MAGKEKFQVYGRDQGKKILEKLFVSEINFVWKTIWIGGRNVRKHLDELLYFQIALQAGMNYFEIFDRDKFF